MNTGDELPMTTILVNRPGLVAECIIAPQVTELLKAAKFRDCTVHAGAPMLKAQVGLMLNFMGAD